MPVYSASTYNLKRVVDFTLGASGNTGKGFYKLPGVTSGGTVTPSVTKTQYLSGDSSGATAILMEYATTSGTFAGGDWAGTLYISESTGTFSVGENVSLKLISDDSTVQSNFATLANPTAYAVDSLDLITSLTAANGIVAGDINGFTKSKAPTSLGVTASVNYQSRAITLSGAVNIDICTCNTATGWSGDNSGAVAYSTTSPGFKLSTGRIAITAPGSPATSTLYAHFDLGSSGIDLSTMQMVSFWAACSVGARLNKWTVKLCSDQAGTTAVLTCDLAVVSTNSQWVSFDFEHSTNLGTIKSVAIYSGASAPTAADVLYIDNVFAAKASTSDDCLHLNKLISFSSADDMTGVEWYPIKSISGTAVEIDNHNANTGASGRGFNGANVTSQTLYTRETIKKYTNTSSSTPINPCQVAGTNNTYVQYQGGINPKTLIQDGYTCLNATNGWGYAIEINNKNFQKIERFCNVRYYYSINSSYANSLVTMIGSINSTGCQAGYSASFLTKVSNKIVFTNNGNSYPWQSNSGGLYSGYEINSSGNLATGAYVSSQALNSYISDYIGKNNANYGLQFAGGHLKIKNLTTSGNATAGVRSDYQGLLLCDNSSIGESTEFSYANIMPYGGTNQISNHDGTANNDYIFAPSATANKQASEKPSDASYAWKLSPTSNIYRSETPFQIILGRFPVEASKEVTLKVRVKVSNANITGGLRVKAGDAGLTTDQTASSVSTTASWGEEITLQFTPPSAGIITVLGEAYFPDGSTTHTYSAYIAHPEASAGVITFFTQAA
jgi:hypothetical protein